jgi:hypothetical protein
VARGVARMTPQARLKPIYLLESSFFKKINSIKKFPMSGSVIENKLETLSSVWLCYEK